MISTAANAVDWHTPLAEALEALVRGEHERVLRLTDDLAQSGGSAYVPWLRFPALAALEKWPQARDELAKVLAIGEPVIELQPGTLPSSAGWAVDETARIDSTGPFLRFVGLAQNSRVWHPLPDLDNGVGTWVAFVVRRSSGGESDCRIELADGTVRETVLIDPGAVRLLSGGSIRFSTNEPHHYGLWVHRQDSHLYVDGRLSIVTRGLPAEGQRFIRLGAYQSPADSESHWSLVRVSIAPERGQLPVEPPLIPEAAWSIFVNRLAASGELRDALTAAVQARLAYPRAEVVGRLLSDVLELCSDKPELYATARRALLQLPLSERRLYTSTGDADRLVSCEGIGVRFERRQTRLSIAQRLRLASAPPTEHFWAVRDVTLEVHAGDLLGIIGRNGAGKTTLLHCLADVIGPDEGSVQISGHALLLSVGAGFITALTGRENIFLSGLYLGMTRAEIHDRFDEIVEFAELWDAIDRPVRTYSSGMMSRLQFALATTVNPDILLLDELLGAGDAAFSEKSRTRMQQMLRRARAVVVVTHDTEFVREQCTKAVLLERGELVYQGSPETAVVLYQDLLERRPKRAERSDAS